MGARTPEALQSLTRAHSDAQERFSATKLGIASRCPTPEQMDHWEILGELHLARLGNLKHLFESDEDRKRRWIRNRILFSAGVVLDLPWKGSYDC